MRTPWRHGVVLIAAALLLWLFAATRPGDLHEVHRWNRAWADVSVVLLAALFLLGPLARVWPPASRSLEWRRELGIWAFVAALVHVGYYAHGAFDWELIRFVQDSEHHGAAGEPLGALDWRRDAWAAANWVGIFALAYGLLPVLTSNDVSQRLLGMAWKRLQDHGHIFYALTMLHMLLFWLLVYRAADAGPAPVLFWVGFGAVAVAEALALIWSVSKRRTQHQGPAPGG